MTRWNGARANALAPSVYTLEQKQKSVTYAPGLMCNLSARLNSVLVMLSLRPDLWDNLSACAASIL